MRAEVSACCCAGNAVSHSATQHGTSELSTCICCPHILGDNYITSFPLLHHIYPYLFLSPVCSYCHICLSVRLRLSLTTCIPWSGSEALTSMISYYLFHRACIHGQSTLLREIHWTHDWFGGKTHDLPFCLPILVALFEMYSARWCTHSQHRLVRHSLYLH